MGAPQPAATSAKTRQPAVADDPHSRRQARKTALISAAGRAFGRKGFHNTTLDEIAKELGVTKPILYRYVTSKHGILYECHNMALSMAEDAYDKAVEECSGPLDRIRRYAEIYIASITSEMGTCVVLTENYSLLPEHRKLIQKRRRVLDGKLRNLIRDAIEAKEIAPCNPKLAAFFFMGAINNISSWFSDEGELGSSEIAVAFSEHVVQGLKPLSRAG